MPTLLSMGTTLNLPLGRLLFSELNFTFPLLLDLSGKGLPDGVSLPALNNYVLPGNLTSLVQYTVMDNFAHSALNHATSSNNIMAQDRFCHGSVSRNLCIAPSSKNLVI